MFDVRTLQPTDDSHPSEWGVWLNRERLNLIGSSGRYAFANDNLVVKVAPRGCVHESKKEFETFQLIPDEFKHYFAKVYTFHEVPESHYSYVVQERVFGKPVAKFKWDMRCHIMDTVKEILEKIPFDIHDVNDYNTMYDETTGRIQVFDMAGCWDE